MSNKQKNISERQKNVEFDIEHWRERFVEIKTIAPKNWMKCLADFNPVYNSHEGSLTMLAVANRRAGLAKTAQLVGDLEEMLKSPKGEESLYQRWKKGGLVSK